jgi:dihydrofolate reductase
MMLSLIVAMAENRVIGKDNDLPWRLPNDLKWFKKHTLGNPIIMGRKTWESIGRPLPGRKNIVVTRNTDYVAEGCEIVHSLEDAIALVGCADEALVIGGAGLYEAALPKSDRIYLTQVDAHVDGDTVFPQFDTSEWTIRSEEAHPEDEKHAYAYTFRVLDRH